MRCHNWLIVPVNLGCFSIFNNGAAHYCIISRICKKEAIKLMLKAVLTEKKNIKYKKTIFKYKKE